MRHRRSAWEILLDACVTSRSTATRVFVALLSAGALWMAAMPFSETVTRATLAKFHLRQSNFALWALQQYLPSMYAFANEVWVYDQAPGEDPVGGAVPAKHLWVNHFPLRVVTYMDRGFYVAQPRILIAQSRYGEETMRTRCRIQPRDSGIDLECEEGR